MNPKLFKEILDRQEIAAEPVHIETNAAVVKGLLEATAQRFGALPLEAEPSGFQGVQRRFAP